MNEFPIGQSWPPFAERAARVEESIKIIRRLWEENFVTFKGRYFSMRDGNLYDRPTTRVPLYVAASGPTMAEMAGRYADGLYTTPSKEEFFRDILFPSMKRGAKKANRKFRGINKMIMCNISWDEDYDTALRSILRWRAVAYPNAFTRLVWDPRKLDEMGRRVPEKELLWRWVICTNLDDSIKKVEKFIHLGFNEIEIRSCSPNERAFISKFGREALPYLSERYKT